MKNSILDNELYNIFEFLRFVNDNVADDSINELIDIIKTRDFDRLVNIKFK